MTTMKKDFSFQGGYDDLLCQKISLAIKKSNAFAHINPSDLIRKRFAVTILNSISEVPLKKSKAAETSEVKNCKDSTGLIPEVMNILPEPELLFHTSNCNKSIVKSECVVKDNLTTGRNIYVVNKANNNSFASQPIDIDKEISVSVNLVAPPVSNVPTSDSNSTKPNQSFTSDNRSSTKLNQSFSSDNRSSTKLNQSFTSDNRSSTKLNQSFTSDNRDISPKIDVQREKQNKDLSNMAINLLPLPTQLFGKDSMLTALEKGNYVDFLNYFKEGVQMESEISADDLIEIIDMIVKKKAFSLIPEVLDCIMDLGIFIEALANSFTKYKIELDKYKNDILKCIESMMDLKNELHLNLFMKTCAGIQNWDKLLSVISMKMPNYVIPDIYFHKVMSVFTKLDGQKTLINDDMLTNIISYVNRAYPSKKAEYLIEIWIYCVWHDINNKDLNSIMDSEVSPQMIDKLIDNLNTLKDPSFIFGMKLLSKNWNLISNNKFCEWFSKLISDKSDVRKCLFTIKDSIHALNRNGKQDIFDNFYLVGIRVMSFLNKKSLFTCSKNVYENFLKNYFPDIKRGLLQVNDKFKLKWTMVECLISSAEYEKALSVIKEFEVLRDLEITCVDYNRVKEILPNLVWHLISSADMLPVITLFEQVISIFIFNENTDRAYRKNCNEIFDLIVIKAFESNNIEVVKSMISLLDLILSANIDFEISKKSLRYLAVAAVRTNIPFKDLLDFVDVCFKFKVFENIETSEDGFGSFVNAYSNLTIEEITLLITWTCRHVKIKLVQSVQNQGLSIRENITKVCSIKFFLQTYTKSDSFCKELKMETSFNEFLIKFTEALNNPKYLKHPIKFSTISDTSDNAMKIVCDNRIVYNTIYYSDI